MKATIVYEENKSIRHKFDGWSHVTVGVILEHYKRPDGQNFYLFRLFSYPSDYEGDNLGGSDPIERRFEAWPALERCAAIRKAIELFDLECGKFEPEPEPEYNPQY